MMRLVWVGLLLALSGPAMAEQAGIKWRDFDAAAFAEAAEQGKLVFLSIQAPWGHWDRMMREITLVDPEVVSLLNERFIPIRVDPLLRPDIDIRYNINGWPTSTFVLPTGHQFYYSTESQQIKKAGANYYTAQNLITVLKSSAAYFAENREGAEALADNIARAGLARQEVGKGKIEPEILEVAITRFLMAYRHAIPDPRIHTPQYPDADSIQLGLYYFLRKGNTEVRDVAIRLLTDMARGGIRDHLGGGFHRYAKDAAWRVPAFEKLLSTNADMLRLYGEVYQLTGNPRYRAIAAGIVRYVTGTLMDPAGWFYAYQVADARTGDDGDYYTWTLDEVKSVLTEEEQKIIVPAFDIQEWGEMTESSPRRNVIFLFDGPFLLSQRFDMDLTEVMKIFDSGRQKLLAARMKRRSPPVGKVLVTDANASMAQALIRVGDGWREKDWRQTGLRAVDFLWSHARDPDSGLMDHVWSPETGRAGRTDLFRDQVSMVSALIAAYESSGAETYLTRARDLAGPTAEKFADSLAGGFMDRLYSADLPGLLGWPTRSIRDNARFAEDLMRLHLLTAEKADGPFIERSREALESWADDYASHAQASAAFGVAAHRFLTSPLRVWIIAGKDGAEDETLRLGALSQYHPWRVVRHITADEAPGVLSERGLEPAEGPAVAFCVEKRCAGPFAPGEDLGASYRAFVGAGSRPGAGAAEKEGKDR